MYIGSWPKYNRKTSANFSLDRTAKLLQLRKFLCGCYGAFTLLYIFVSFGTVPRIARFSQEIAINSIMPDRTPAQNILTIFVSALAMLILAIPLVVAFLNGMAWWTVKKGKTSARGWAIAASISLLLSSIPLVLPMIYSWKYFPVGVIYILLAICGAMIVLGIAGLVAFAPRDAMAQPVVAAKPPRIAGDGTSGLIDGIAWIIGIAGYIAGMNWWYRWGRAQHLAVSNGYQSWLQIFAAILIVTTLHESGHATTGMALGMKLRAFIVGPFQWRIRDGRWKFQFLPAKLFSAGGATALVPIDPEQSHWKDICMIAAGPLANLLTGLIALAATLTATGRPYEQYWLLLARITTISLVVFAVNLLPSRPEALYSDGARIYQLLRGGPWADLHRAFAIVTSTTVTSLRPRDYDIQVIQQAASSFTQGRQALLLRMFASYYFFDCGKIPEARQAFSEAESVYHESASDIPAELHTDFVFGAAFLQRDADGARQWWERMEAKKPTHFGVDYWLAQSALHWIEGHREEAHEAWSKGNTMAQQRPAAGVYEFDRYRYTLLRQALDAAPAAD